MRRVRWIPLLVLLGACRTQDLAPPALRRPLEGLPAGARVVVLTSDLQNTWQRLEALELATALESMPALAAVLHDSGTVRLRDAYRDLETRTGTSLRDDVLLNAVGGRAALGMYSARAESEQDDADALLVAELADADRFGRAIRSLRDSLPTGDWSIEDETFEGGPAWRCLGPEGHAVLVVQRGALLVAATEDDLVRRALAVNAGSGEPAALAEPDFVAALGAVGPQNVVALVRPPERPDTWLAQGFTWDRSGLHFEHVRTAVAAPPVAGNSSREALLGSVPDGMTLACWARTSDSGLWHLFEPRAPGVSAEANDAEGEQDDTGAGVMIPGLPFGPAELRAWAGDEVAFALAGIEATPLAPIPNVGLLLEVRDAEAAARGLHDLESQLASLPVGPTARGFQDVAYGGRTYRTLVQPLSESVSPSWLLDGDVAIVTTTRTLMQQIIDTRRTGKRTLLADAAFRKFGTFVPGDACAVAYADQRRLHLATQQLGGNAPMWGEHVRRSVLALESVAALLEHFPAGAAYAARADDQLAVRGWMLEAD